MRNTHEVPGIDDASEPGRVERRRPGRMSKLGPTLMPLLDDDAEPSPDWETGGKYHLVPATGIAIGVVISGLMWALIVWITWSIGLILAAREVTMT